MRLAVVTDIHSNLPALEAVLGAIDAVGAERIWCLGDVLGYGADPDACANLVRERCELCLVGNHDLAVIGELDVKAFSRSAAEAVLWTRDQVAESTLAWLRGLEPAARQAGIALFHASPLDPVWEYVVSGEQARACLAAQPERIGLIGHSHVALFFAQDGAGAGAAIRGARAAAGTSLDLGGGRWLLNPGSVGQPRDGDPRAAWLELDPDLQTARFHRISYDIERVAASIAAAGLPIRLADRLFVGQ